jgi:hypothetical protein
VSVGLGAWLLRGRALPGPAGAPFGVTCMIVMLAFGLVQWRGEYRGGLDGRPGWPASAGRTGGEGGDLGLRLCLAAGRRV